jgi:hypothetical protein
MTASESRKTKYEFDGNVVWAGDQTILREAHMNKVCPLCRGSIKEGDKCKLIVNNYTLFPNVFVHTDCFTKNDPIETIKWLQKDYKDYLHIIKMYDCWR